ncbi:hypothetical protein MTO96_011129 [Rhipicephalus appendiculatus]
MAAALAAPLRRCVAPFRPRGRACMASGFTGASAMRTRGECLDLPRLTFPLALRRFGDSLAVSLMVLVEELERFLAAHSRGFSCGCLAGERVFTCGLRCTRCLPQLSSRRGSDGLRCQLLHRRAHGRSTAWRLGSRSLVGRASGIVVSSSLALRTPGLSRTVVGLRPLSSTWSRRSGSRCRVSPRCRRAGCAPQRCRSPTSGPQETAFSGTAAAGRIEQPAGLNPCH